MEFGKHYFWDSVDLSTYHTTTAANREDFMVTRESDQLNFKDKADPSEVRL